MTIENPAPGPAANAAGQAGPDVQFKELAERVAQTADSDLKHFLSGILRATEKQVADLDATRGDLKVVREKLDKAEAEASAAAERAAKDRAATVENTAKSALRAAAKAAGAIDPADVLPFIKAGDVKADEDGKTNEAELVDALKKAKPHLFGKLNTSATAPTPNPKDAGGVKSVLEMTPAEYKAAKARFTSRR
jgi:hypothetical protein